MVGYLNNTSGVFIESMNVLYAVGSYEEGGETMPLLLLFREEIKEAYISNSGVDDGSCGHVDYTCRSLSKAFGNLKTEKKTAIFYGGTLINTNDVFDKHSYNISCVDYWKTWVDIQNSTFITSVETIFYCIRFKYPDSRAFPAGSTEPVSVYTCVASNLTFNTTTFDLIYNCY